MARESLRAAFTPELWNGFELTWLTEIIVITVGVAFFINDRRQENLDLGPAWASYRRRHAIDRSSIWSLPILMWAAEASVGWDTVLSGGCGLVSISQDYYYQYVFLATGCLGLLAAVQSIACLLLRHDPSCLGSMGMARWAVIGSFSAVMLDFFLYLTIWRW